MKNVLVDKVTLNIGVGEAGEKVNKAGKVLQTITGQKSVNTSSKKRIPTWGIRPGVPIATKVTVRGKSAEELLKRLLNAVDNVVYERSFDKIGNISFGIRSYIDITDMKYDPSTGIFGLDVCVSFKRKGYRVKIRRRKPSKIGSSQLVTPEDTKKFLKDKYGVTIK
ncbi:MAG: 50S ribosomal protein L5 [Nanoarchaeota archaeon]|nr:50S ribosomal protein L5 [Nanoarchaeota archaeon]